MVWLNQRFNQSFLKLSVLSFCMMNRLMLVQRIGGRSQMFVSYGREISPHLFLYLFYSKKKQRWKQTRALPVWTPESQNHLIIFIIIIILYIYLLKTCSPNFSFFSLTQARLKWNFQSNCSLDSSLFFYYFHCSWK